MGIDLLTSHDIFKFSQEDSLDRGQSLSRSKVLSGSLSTPIPTVEDGPMAVILEAEFGQNKNDYDHENYKKKIALTRDALDILESMRQSCETAVSTLNDVLLYDKIEGGTMVLEKRKISVIHLLNQTIKPFFMQVV